MSNHQSPASPVQIVVACGSCGHYHRSSFAGDCREDTERFTDPQEAANRLGAHTRYVDEDGCESPEVFNPGEDRW